MRHKARHGKLFFFRSALWFGNSAMDRTPSPHFHSRIYYATAQPLLRRIAAEKNPPLDCEPDPALMAAERIVEQLELSRYEVRERADKPR